MMKTLGVIGSGDLGQQIAYYAVSDGHYKDVVFFDDFTKEKKINSHRVIGKCDAILDSYNDNIFDELLIGIGYKHLNVKAMFYDTYKNSIPFGKIIHSSSWVDKSATVKSGTVIYPKVSIDANVVVSSNCIVNIGGTIAHDSFIDEHCFLSPCVAIAGFVTINKKCIIGINSTIIDNIKITEETQLGGATVVVKEIKDKGLYVGNPARFIRD